jgi:hypothetical protein
MAEPDSGTTIQNETTLAVDGSFQLTISSDGMEAFLEAIKPATGGGPSITIEQVLSALKKSGVNHGIATDKITQIIIAINTGDQCTTPQEPISIATGDTAVAGEDSQLQWHVNEEQLQSHNFSLLPGELIATYQPATQGKLGKNVYGKTVPAAAGHNNVLHLGNGIETIKTEQGDEYRAKWFGIIEYDGQILNVDSTISVSDDNMEVHMDIHPRSVSGAAVELTHILDALDKNGIKHGIDETAIQQALTQAASTDSKQCIKQLLVATGTPLKSGKDARLVISHDDLTAGKELNDGSIDFHEHGYPRNVKKGETIGYLLEAKDAANGTTIHGKIIEAHAPKIIELELTGLHRDERGKLVADIDGALIISGSHLEIVDLLIIDGDVAQKTGNIHSDIPVHVKGHIEPGFILESKKEVIIENNVEDAIVHSGSNVVIKGGIRGRHSELFAPGDISVGFIENAKVFVNGNITIRASIINSEVASNSTIIVGDKRARHSAVMGGVITAHTLVEAITLGSPAYAKTLIRIGMAQETRRQLNKLETEIEKKQQELTNLDQIENRYKKSTNADTATLMRKIQTTREASLTEIAAYKEQEAELLTTLKQTESAKVVVHKNTLPGVIICINEQRLEITHELGKGTFTLTDDGVTFHPG